jgi:hypothetical protein
MPGRVRGRGEKEPRARKGGKAAWHPGLIPSATIMAHQMTWCGIQDLAFLGSARGTRSRNLGSFRVVGHVDVSVITGALDTGSDCWAMWTGDSDLQVDSVAGREGSRGPRGRRRRRRPSRSA